MFETSVVSARVANKGRRAGLLTASLIAHTAVIVGSVAVSIASVNFPTNAPDEYSVAPLVATVQIPPPLGNPNGGAKPQQAPREKAPTPPPQNQINAPTNVPDEVIPVQSASTNSGENTSGNTEGQVEGPIGVPWGDKNSISTDLTLPPAVVVDAPQVEDRVYQAHEVKAPVVVRRVEPRFPFAMMRAGVSGVVAVKCIIDKNGNVRDAQVVRGSLPPFNAAVLEAVQQWKFTPGSLRGQAVDSYLELTVNFNVKR